MVSRAKTSVSDRLHEWLYYFRMAAPPNDVFRFNIRETNEEIENLSQLISLNSRAPSLRYFNSKSVHQMSSYSKLIVEYAIFYVERSRLI
jgi:hypothetical protein